MKDYLGYAGKTCVVTGGSNGMGKTCVEMLIDLGATVYVLDTLPCDVSEVKYVTIHGRINKKGQGFTAPAVKSVLSTHLTHRSLHHNRW